MEAEKAGLAALAAVNACKSEVEIDFDDGKVTENCI